MKIDFNKNEDVINVAVEGRLDTTTAPEFDSFIAKNLDGVKSLVINCKKLEYLSSAGLRVLLVAHKKMDGNMKLINVGEIVMEVFELTGFSDVLVIE